MAMVAVTAALIGFFAFVIMRVTTPQLTTLFTDLSVEDSSAIIKDLERQAILGAIRTLNGDKLQAAKLLGIGKTTLYRKLKEYGINDPLHEE